MYTDIDIIKKHCNIDEDYYADDEYLINLFQTSEKIVEKEIDHPLSDLEDDNGNIPMPLVHAMLLMTGNFYANRESVAFANSYEIPYSFKYLCDLYKDYNHKCKCKED